MNGILDTILQRKDRNVEQAEAELTKLKKVRDDLAQELDSLTQLVNSAGDAFLEATLDPESENQKIVSDISAARNRREIVSAALGKATAAVEQAERNLYLAQAKEKRSQAAEIRQKVIERQKITDSLLRQLEEHEGVKFGVALYYNPVGIIQPGREIPPTKTMLMLLEAQQLEWEAVKLEAQGEGRPIPVYPHGLEPGKWAEEARQLFGL